VRYQRLQKLSGFGWQQWLVLIAFVLVLAFTGLYAARTIREARYWRNHRDEPIRGWMTIGYVAHSYHVPPYILAQALGLPHRPPDRRPLREIAREQNRSMDEVQAILQDAITHARPPYPPPPPPDAGGSP
jgi:hypothetical protein